MKEVYDNNCLPKGFSAAGTYSGLCDSRVKLDVAMITSQADCAIVMAGMNGTVQGQGKVLLLHNGAALPKTMRGQEIHGEICDATAAYLSVQPQDVAFIAHGTDGQYFRPSLLINSLATLDAALSPLHGWQVGAVLDNAGDMMDTTVMVGTDASLHGIAADGTENKPGLCVLMTDAALSPGQLQKAMDACMAEIHTEGYTMIALANGMATEAVSEAVLVQAMKNMMVQLGFQPVLQACS